MATTGGNVGIGTTTPGSLLSLSGIANFTTATSTFYSTGGINLTAGCFAINGTCVGGAGGSGTVGSGTTGQFPYYAANGTTLTATSSLFIAANGQLGIGTTTPNAALVVNGAAYIELQTLATSTSMTVDFCTTNNMALMGVGNANITFAWTNADNCRGKSILLSNYSPLTGAIGTTTFSGGSGSGAVIWSGGIDPGSTVVNGTTDDFCFTSTASTTRYIAASLCGQH